MLTIGIVVYPGFQALGLSLGAAFETANLLTGKEAYSCVLTSLTGGLVTSSQGFKVDTVCLLGKSFDTLIILGDNDCAPQADELLAYLHDAQNSVRRIAGICTGAFVLAAAKLLDGRRATTHWAFARDLKKNYPLTEVEEDRIFVIDENIWTSAGMTAGLDLALALVEKDLGAEVTRQIARKLVLYQRRGGGQSQFSALLDLDAKSDRVQTALAFARENLREDLSIAVLAGAARLSPRQFSRVFREETGLTPAKAIERLRVEAARLMIETTRHPVEMVAQETGFGDRERMRQSFLRAYGIPPQAVQRASSQSIG